MKNVIGQVFLVIKIFEAIFLLSKNEQECYTIYKLTYLVL